MQNFDWSQFTKRISVKADIAAVYNAWASAEEIEKWFLSAAVFYDTEGKEIPHNASIEKSGSYKWTWYAYDDSETGIILDANGKDMLAFTFAGNCRTVVKLTQLEQEVLVELTQSEIPGDDLSRRDIRLGCAFGWTFYLLNLKSVLEGGLDLRNKDRAITAVVNN